MKAPLLAALLLALPTAASAHEIWVERDGVGPARIYLGEPNAPLPEGGDPEFDKLKAPKLLAAPNAAGVRKAGYIEVAHPAGDVRVWDDAVFQPWGEEGKKQSIVYYARAGRADPTARMPVEIVPAAANADRFILVRDGKPVPGATVTVITPDKWSKTFTTDATGGIAVPVRETGRYLLSANIEDTAGPHATPAGPVATLHRTTTTTFVAG
jgi:hypothetical protein